MATEPDRESDKFIGFIEPESRKTEVHISWWNRIGFHAMEADALLDFINPRLGEPFAEATSIEALLAKHPQTINVCPFAADVAAMRTAAVS
jgi:hypothetical protein